MGPWPSQGLLLLSGMKQMRPSVWIPCRFAPVLVYAGLGSSRQLAVGPVAVTSLLIGSGLPPIVPGYKAAGISSPNTPVGEVQIAAQQVWRVHCSRTKLATLDE